MPKLMRVMTLGYSTVGKTYFLGSLFKLSSETGQRGFSLQHKDFYKLGNFQDIYDTITTEKVGAIGTTMGLKTAHMELRKGLSQVFDIEITDVEGQAIQPGRNEGTAEEIIEKIDEYDGLILILEAPGRPAEKAKDKSSQEKAQVAESKEQLNQMLRFAGEVLAKNEGIPIALVLNKIDELPELKGIKDEIEAVDKELEDRLGKQLNNDYMAVMEAIRIQRGELINQLIKQAVDKKEIYSLISQFSTWMKTSGVQIPHRVFPCTSLGFDNAGTNPADSSTLVSSLGYIEPYGTAAVFLWLIYARLKAVNATSPGIRKFIDGDPTANAILEDLTELFTSGKAYFDNSTPLWSIRNMANLYPTA